MSNPERLFFDRITGSTEELRVVIVRDTDVADTPMTTATPTPRDVALAVGASSDEWFMDFVAELKRSDIRVAAARAFGPLPPHDPDFGVDPEDSARLLELRDAIDSYLGWKSQEDEEEGNYVFRIREIGDMLWNCKAAFIEHKDAELMAQIMLSVTKMAGENLRKHPTINHKFDVAGAATAENRCSCMAHVHAHPGGVCGAVGAEWHNPGGWPDSMMLCPVCIKHPADEAIDRLTERADRADKLDAKVRRQRRELKRLNRDEHLRQQQREHDRAFDVASKRDLNLEEVMSGMTKERIEEVLAMMPISKNITVADLLDARDVFASSRLMELVAPEWFKKEEPPK